MRHRPLAFVDLETTGLSPGSDRIVEIGIVTVDDGNAEEWTRLVHPGRRVSRIAHSYSGISDDMLAAAIIASQADSVTAIGFSHSTWTRARQARTVYSRWAERQLALERQAGSDA